MRSVSPIPAPLGLLCSYSVHEDLWAGDWRLHPLLCSCTTSIPESSSHYLHGQISLVGDIHRWSRILGWGRTAPSWAIGLLPRHFCKWLYIFGTPYTPLAGLKCARTCKLMFNPSSNLPGLLCSPPALLPHLHSVRNPSWLDSSWSYIGSQHTGPYLFET